MQHTESNTDTQLKQRFLRLADGRPGLRSGFPVEVRTPEPTAAPGANGASEPAVLDFIASTGALDRFQEIIEPDGWRLEAYRRNPVFQNAHQYGDILFTLGKALITDVRQIGGRKVLFQRVQFAVEINPLARVAYGLYRGHFLNAVSVGFIPLRWENGTAESGFRRRYLEQELVEVSAVGIPANPEALQLGVRSGAVREADLREAVQLLRLLAGRSGQNSVPLPEPAPDSELFQLARDLHQVMRGLTQPGAGRELPVAGS